MVPYQSHRCRIVQRMPWRASATRDLPDGAGAGTCRIISRQKALMTNVPASMANAVPVPPAATRTPPAAGPRNDSPTVWLAVLKALPWVSRSGGSSSGMIARYAG